jgi:dimethylglycine dehydrogenase
VKARANGVGVTEIANFAKYRVHRPGREAFLSRLMTNKMPKTGRIVLTPMLNEAGKLIGDFTIAKAATTASIMWGSSQAQKYHMRWFERICPRMARCDPPLRHDAGRPVDRRPEVARRCCRS